MCNKCEDAGKRGGRHSALIPALPLVKCNRYHQLDHISKNYTNPRGCPFRVHLVSTFSFHAFAAHPCYGIISFRVSIYFPFEWSSFPRLSPGGYHCRFRFSPPPPFVCLLVYISFQLSFHAFAGHPCYGTNFVSVFQFIFLSGGLRFPALGRGGITVGSVSPLPSPFVCLLVYISFQLYFSCVRRTPLLRYKFRFRVSVYFPFGWSFVFSCTSRFNSPFHAFAARPCYGTNFVSVFQFIFLSGGLRDPWATPLRVPQ